MKFINLSKAAILLLVAFTLSADGASDESLAKFSQYSEISASKMDFSIVDQMMNVGVLNMGPSTRAYANRGTSSTGTRLKQYIDPATENEANRFFYENLTKEQDQMLLLRQELEAIPSVTPLHQFTKEAQLAYWLNLYNVTLINELAIKYPLNNLKPVLTGEDSILDKKLLTVDNTPLSLNDIHYRVVPLLYPDDPFYIYGFHQGIKGSPNIRSSAYTESNVKQSLLDNAREFVNSNRGTQFNGGDNVIRVSSFYERNAKLFQDFKSDIKSHLLQYADRSIHELIGSASTFVADIDNWRINDLYGSIRRRDYGLSINTGDGFRIAGTSLSLSSEQNAQLRTLMRVRAKNFGGGKVTVTDLDPEEENTTSEENESQDQ